MMNRRHFMMSSAAAAFGGVAAATAAQDIDDAQKPPKAGQHPAGWETGMSGTYNEGNIAGELERDYYGEAAKKLEVTPRAECRIVADATAPKGGNVLELTSQGTVAWCVKPDVKIRDGYVEVKAKWGRAVPQHIWSSGLGHPPNPNEPDFGVVWRYQDAKNFYYAATEGSAIKMYKVVDGEFEENENSRRIDFSRDQWYTFRVEFTGSTAKAIVNGREVCSTIDRDIRKAGAAGVIVNGDACTHFTDFKSEAFASSQTETFDEMTVYAPPPTPWKCGDAPDITAGYPLSLPLHPVTPPTWEVILIRHTHPGEKQESLSNVLRVSSYGRQPYCVKSDVNLRDGYVEVEAKPISGEHERVIGVIFRWQDEKNYYLARAECEDPKGDLIFYKMVNGKRTLVERSRLLDTPDNVWHTIRAEFAGNKVDLYWNGKHVVSATDDSITQGGAVGVWTKLDAVAYFDNLSWGESSEQLKAAPPVSP